MEQRNIDGYVPDSKMARALNLGTRRCTRPTAFSRGHSISVVPNQSADSRASAGQGRLDAQPFRASDSCVTFERIPNP